MNKLSALSIRCPVCTSHAMQVAYSLAHGYLIRCPVCSLVSYAPQPTPEELDDYYNSLTYRECYEAGDMTGHIFAENRYQQFNKTLLEYQPKFSQSDHYKMLDLGCGVGDFLLASKRANWQVSGIEISSLAAQKANQKLEQDCVLAGKFDSINLPLSAYDVVTCYHVIEHLLEPMIMLESIYKLLKPGGVVFLETPNIGSLGAKIKGVNWSQIKPPEHIAYFNSKSLDYALRKAGFSHVKTLTIRPQRIKSLEKLPDLLRGLASAMYAIAPLFKLGASLQAIATKPDESFVAKR